MATPYMVLDLPVVTVTLGPEWATLLNAALEVIDNHDHTSGRGRLITSAALNINDDVSIGGFNLTNARSYNMQNLGSPIGGATDIRSLYAVGGELFYNDGVGNQIQITSGGALDASSVGGIGGDYGTSTASVYYNSISKTFFFDQNTDQRAKMDIGDLIIRETVAAANGITIKSPATLAASYALTLPAALPLADNVLKVSSTGVVSPSLVTDPLLGVDAVTNTKIQNNAVTTAKIADDQVTPAKLAPAAINDSYITETFTVDGTFNVPAGITQVWLSGSGGGGGGGAGGSGTTAGGGGGGEGAPWYEGILITVTPLAAMGVDIGAAGAGAATNTAPTADGAAGSNGAPTEFGTVSLRGGRGGAGGLTGSSGGAGGSSTSGNPSFGAAGGGGGAAGAGGGASAQGSLGGASLFTGQGSIGASGNNSGGGGSGGSCTSTGGNGGNSGSPNGQAGSNATGGNGGGGGGGGGGASGNGGAGGNGTAGILYVRYFKSN